MIGQLVRLRQSGQTPTDFHLQQYETWNNNDLIKRLNLVNEIIERINDIGLPQNHPWNGVTRESILPGELDRLLPKIQLLLDETKNFQSSLSTIAKTIGLTLNHNPSKIQKKSRILRKLLIYHPNSA